MESPRPLNICIVTADIVGPVRNGGIGTWYHALATALADAGHRVTVLYTLGQWCENKTLGHWIDWYRQKKIEFIPLPPYPGAILDAALWVQVSFQVYDWLKSREHTGQIFDVIHFHEWRGNGFYSTLARRQGLALANSVICVGTHSPLLWHKFGMGEFISELEELQTDFLERQSVQYADVVVSPSHYMIDWIIEQGWKLPTRVEIRQYIQSHFLPSADLAPPQRQPVHELVFFGRLETRKGIVLFCDALDRLSAEKSKLSSDLSITFLGKCAIVEGVEAQTYIERRAANWPFPWKIVDFLDHAGAIDYLRQPGRMAVICSLLENSPNTVLECLVNRVPCLSTNIGGNPELIAEPDRTRVTFDPRPPALAKKLLEAITDGFIPALPAIPPEQTRQEWLDWHQRIVQEISSPAPVIPEDPLVSVCLVHRNRPKYLEQAIESLRRQDYPRLEVVLVDDGSDDPATLQYLDVLEPEFAQKNWLIIRQENLYLGAARNNGALRARGDFLLFMDDDNFAKPQEISAFVRAARYSGADVLTCCLDGFSGPDMPVEGNPQTHRWLALGGAINVGVFTNLIGDANGLVKKSTFLALGGFTEDFGVGHEDWELFAKAALNDYVVQVVPESLYFYRVGTGSMLRTTSGFANHMRSLRPYLAAAPKLRTTLEYTLSLFMLLARRTADASTLYDRTLAYEAQIAAKSAQLGAQTATTDQLAAAHAAAEARAQELEKRSQEAESRGRIAQTHAQTVEARAQAVEARAAANEARALSAEARAAAAEAQVQSAEASAREAHANAAETTAHLQAISTQLNGDIAGYQRIVDSYWDSLSWRISAPVRNGLRAARGMSPQQRPVIHSRAEADQVVNSIRNSFCWEALAGLRIIGRAFNKLRGK